MDSDALECKDITLQDVTLADESADDDNAGQHSAGQTRLRSFLAGGVIVGDVHVCVCVRCLDVRLHFTLALPAGYMFCMRVGHTSKK